MVFTETSQSEQFLTLLAWEFHEYQIFEPKSLIRGQILWPAKIMYVYLLAGPHKKTRTENCPRFTWSDSAQRRWIIMVHVKIDHSKSSFVLFMVFSHGLLIPTVAGLAFAHSGGESLWLFTISIWSTVNISRQKFSE